MRQFKEIVSNPTAIIGLFANIGLASIVYLIVLEINRWVDLSTLWDLNIFFIIYLVSYILSLKYLVKNNEKLKFSFIISFILVALVVLIGYLKLFIGF